MFFHCGVVDRTQTVPDGPSFRILDPLEAATEPPAEGEATDES